MRKKVVAFFFSYGFTHSKGRVLILPSFSLSIHFPKPEKQNSLRFIQKVFNILQKAEARKNPKGS